MSIDLVTDKYEATRSLPTNHDQKWTESEQRTRKVTATEKVENSCLLIGLAEPVLLLDGAYKILGERRCWVGVALNWQY